MKKGTSVYQHCLIAMTICAMGITILGCTDKGPNTPPIQPLSYYPLSVGNTWTYAPADTFYGSPVQWRLTERHGDTITLNRPSGASHSGTVTLLDRSTEIDILFGNQGFVPFYRFTAGATWLHRDFWECDDSSGLVAVVEPNPVVTPAGTFMQCLRIERRTTIPCVDAGTVVEWWAPDVGLVRWDELNFYVGGPLTIYLMSYDVH